MNLEEQATELLLRSPNLSVSQVLELMDISDGDFREMLKRNARIATLIEKRRAGGLERVEPTLGECPACREWFLPYASARFCSDECAQIGAIEGGARSGARAQRRR